MIVDASALVAVVAQEPGRDAFLRAMADAPSVRIAAINLFEALLVSSGPGLEAEVLALVEAVDGTVVPCDEALTMAAFAAHKRYGRGRHPARLNLGDCFAYALAKTSGRPLLYKGGDFARTDLRAALPL